MPDFKDEDLIDVSEFEGAIDDDALTVLDRGEEELTPIRSKSKKPAKITPTTAISRPKETPVKYSQKGTYVASLRDRFTAFSLDILFLFYAYFVYSVIYGRIFLGSWDADIPFRGWHGAAFNGSFLFACFIYFFILEGIFLCSLGKFVCWMSVRRKDFEAPSLVAVLVRNLFRIIDTLLIIPSAVIMEITTFRQRLGDLLAGTTVVKKNFGRSKIYQVTNDNIALASGRTIAAAVDMGIFAAFLLGYIMLLDPNKIYLSRTLFLLTPAVCIIYFVLIEMITETSPGKWLLGYKICQDTGHRLTMSGAYVRTIWKIFRTALFSLIFIGLIYLSTPLNRVFAELEGTAAYYLSALIIISLGLINLLFLFLSTTRQYPGDAAAGTYVIKDGRSLKGALALPLALVFAAGTLYFGMMNKQGILSEHFRFTFLPKLPIIKTFNFDKDKMTVVKIDNFRFAANMPNNIRTPPMFEAGETVYLVFEINGYTKQERKVWLQEDLSITYPNGTVGLKQDNIIDYKDVVKGEGPIELTNNITLPVSAGAGQYKVGLTLRDKLSGIESKAIKIFYVKKTVEETVPAPEAEAAPTPAPAQEAAPAPEVQTVPAPNSPQM